jgi:methylmalonyl-CoA mutase
MTEPRSEAALFSEFAPVSAQAWKTRIEAELKGADFEKTLTRLTDEGIRIQPFYTAEDVKAQLPPAGSLRTEKGWRNCPSLLLTDLEEARTQLKTLLPGAEALCLEIPVGAVQELSSLLAELPLEELPLLIKASQSPLLVLRQIKEAAEKQGITLAQVKGALEFDPLTTLAPAGSYNEAEMAEVMTFRMQAPGLQLLAVDGASFHNRGGTAVQELAFTLSAAVEYLHRLTDDGVALADALGAFTFRVAAGTDYFLEIAKLRALRQLWKAVVLQFEGTLAQAAQLKIHSVTSNWNQTLLDPHTNLLRATTEAMSAMLGGCDYLTVKPFDSVTRPGGTEFSQRIARNISIILKEESYLDRTTDAAAGSYFIEQLTAELVSQSWNLFLEMEQNGGFLRNIRSGYINDQLEASQATKLKAVASRKQIIVGTNQFVNPTEKPAAVAVTSNYQQVNRAGSAFENLRLTGTANSGNGETKGLVQIALLGTTAQRKARAAFAAELLSLGGFKSYRQEYATPEELPKHLLEKTNAAIVLCAADEDLSVWLPAFSLLLQNKPNAPELFIAAPETAVSPELRENVTGFVYQGMNTVSFLSGLRQTITGNQNF